MELNEYQLQAQATAEYPRQGDNLLYPAIGLGEEAGEVLGKVKKLWRNRGVKSALDAEFTEEDRQALIKECGDILWYTAAMLSELKCSMNDCGRINLEKLADRKARGVIKSEGDSR